MGFLLVPKHNNVTYYQRFTNLSIYIYKKDFLLLFKDTSLTEL